MGDKLDEKRFTNFFISLVGFKYEIRNASGFSSLRPKYQSMYKIMPKLISCFEELMKNPNIGDTEFKKESSNQDTTLVKLDTGSHESTSLGAGKELVQFVKVDDIPSTSKDIANFFADSNDFEAQTQTDLVENLFKDDPPPSNDPEPTNVKKEDKVETLQIPDPEGDQKIEELLSKWAQELTDRINKDDISTLPVEVYEALKYIEVNSEEEKYYDARQQEMADNFIDIYGTSVTGAA